MYDLASGIDWVREGQSYLWPAGVIVVFLLLFHKQIGEFLSDLEFFKTTSGGPEFRRRPPPQSPAPDEPPPPGNPPAADAPPPALPVDARRLISEEEVRALNEQWASLVNWYAFNWHYERVYRTIFGSQIGLLRELVDAANGLDITEVHNYYQRHLTLVSSSEYNYPFHGFIAYLKAMNLIMESNGRFFVTDVGRGYLHWMDRETVPDKLF
jgi:hypothetical protein